MLESLIKILQKISHRSKNNSNNGLGMRVILILLLLIPGGFFGIMIIRGLFLDGDFIEALISLPFLILSVFYIFRIGGSKTNQEASKRFSYEAIPATILSFLIVFFIALKFGGDFSDFPNLFAYTFPLLLVGLYPVLQILGSIFKNIKNTVLFQKLEEISLGYNFMLCFIFITHTLLTLFGIPGFPILHPIQEFLHEIMGDLDYVSGIIELFFITLILLIVFLFQIRITYDYLYNFGNSKKKFLKYFLVTLVILNITSLGTLKDKFYTYTIENAQQELQENGENYESYKDAQGFFLEKAFLSQIKKGKFRSEKLFSKIYDATPEEYFGEKIAEYRSDRRSFGTDSSKVGEQAKVILSLAEINNTIIEDADENFIESEYIFHFQNADSMNQEVIFHFQTPSQHSVITNLVLGLNGELQGQIAPRGAARKVYEESLRRNIDPALIERMGLNSYSLRVFPILGKNDRTTKGKQKVAVTVLTPVLENDFIYSPKFSYINLKTDDDSRVLAKIYNDNTLIQENIKKGDEVDTHLSISHKYNTEIQATTGSCYHPFLADIIKTTGLDAESKKDLSESISIFFDNSSSVQRNNAHEIYESIYEQVKNYEGTLRDVHTYSYNFDVKKITDIDDIQYWGYSDTDSIVKYITENKIEKQRIIIVTDDSSFNSSSNDVNFSNSVLGSNRISVVKVGEKIKTYKSDFNLMLSATQGNIYDYSENTFEKDLEMVMSDTSSMGYTVCEEKPLIQEGDDSPVKSYLDEQYEIGDEKERELVDYIRKLEIRIKNRLFFPFETGCKKDDSYCNFDIEQERMSEYLSTKYIEYKLDNVIIPSPERDAALKPILDGFQEREMRIIKDFLLIIYNNGERISEDQLFDKNILTASDFVQAGFVGDLLLSQANQNDIQKTQNEIAENFGIVNHYNSYIALETERQQRDLDIYSEQQDAYEVQHDNGGTLNESIELSQTMFVPGNDRIIGSDTINSSGFSISGRGESVLAGSTAGGGSFMGMSEKRMYGYDKREFSSDISFLGLFKLILYIYFIFSYFNILTSFFRKEEKPGDSNTPSFLDKIKKVFFEKNIDPQDLSSTKQTPLKIPTANLPNELGEHTTVDTIHSELVELYESGKITDLKKKCINYMSQGFDDPKISFYLKKALEEENK